MRWVAVLCFVALSRSAVPATATRSWGVTLRSRWRGEQAVSGSWGAFVKSQRRAGPGVGQSWPVTAAEVTPREASGRGDLSERQDGAESRFSPSTVDLHGLGAAATAGRPGPAAGNTQESVMYGTARTAPFYASLQSTDALSTRSSLPDSLNLTFSVDGLRHTLTLRRAPNVLDPSFLLLRRHSNGSSASSADGDTVQSCLYRGDVRRADVTEPGWAALDLCRHLTGAMRIAGQDLVLEAVDAGRRARSVHPTLIGPQTLRRVATPHCGVMTPPAAPAVATAQRHRSRRRAGRRPRLTVELAVFVDLALQQSMQELYGRHTDDEITRYVMTMVNAMELLYDDKSLQRSVRFVLKRLELLETAPEELERHRDINAFLTSFCQWQQKNNPASDADPLHWDHAVLLTGEDLYTADHGREVNRQVVGFAPVGGMCTAASSCTVNEGKDFESVYIVAHEIGHSLGMHHDGQGNDCDAQGHIMSPTLGTGKNTWSSCSRDYLDKFAASRQAQCLFDANGKEDDSARIERQNTLPGERIGADEQCRLKYGPESHRARRQPLADVCANLHCKYDHHRWTSHPALEGTACGYDSWCRRGRCTPRAPSADADGGWSAWSELSSCASSCLTGGSVGLRKRTRRCSNPYPRGAGASCVGGARQFELCADAALCRRIGEKTVDEYARDICAKAARRDSTLTGRGTSRSASSAREACSIWCERRGGGLQRHRQAFPDGVRCQLRGSDRDAHHFCVDGTCERFHCAPDSLFLTGGAACGRQQLRQLTVPETPPNRQPPANAVSDGGGGGGGKWSSWRSYSRCRFQCTAPAQGLELVQRECARAPCAGLARSVRHCAPRLDGTDCRSLHTPFEFASAVCQRYKEQLSLAQLSGVGLQLSGSPEDPDRPCTVTCQDRDAALRFYRVKGRDGWFPSGLDCARGEAGRTAYCLSGKCVDFGADGTPLHDAQYDYAYLFESSFRYHRVTRGAPPLPAANLTRPGNKRIRGSVDGAFIQRVIGELSRDQPAESNISASDIDLGNPLLLARLPPEAAPPPDTVPNELSHAFALLEPSLKVGEVERQPRAESGVSAASPARPADSGQRATLLLMAVLSRLVGCHL